MSIRRMVCTNGEYCYAEECLDMEYCCHTEEAQQEFLPPRPLSNHDSNLVQPHQQSRRTGNAAGESKEG